MAVADDGRFAFGRLASDIAPARQRAVQFLFQHRLDEAANAGANPVLDQIKPAVEKKRFDGDRRRFGDILCHGVVSFPALQRWNHVG